ncbi:hypothetical protein PISMIDRAFT_107189 [Pisolithus microcarpus 441]|uniref:Phosphatidylinositol N-acetylglucosaminyltransferase subunit H conserved domain-containing protein n=1 Tax=Pisolithus microcarpus 441 TaxID=765257 RepID=A0A0C9Y4K3_9AGAM|nr:hypothetical protein PISMIDRAFT_107189 [Pisolithus microcarpus 441]
MRSNRPLLDTHPEFSVIEWPTFHEYRVENWRLARDGSGRIIRGAVTWTWLDLCLPLLISFLWPKVGVFLSSSCSIINRYATIFSFFDFTESVLVFPALGIQLETHCGHPSLGPLFVSRRFIHVSRLEDFVIHEGLRRWNVRYFLAVIKRSNNGSILFHVAFENILPYFPVLLEVYTGVQCSVFPLQPRDSREIP